MNGLSEALEKSLPRILALASRLEGEGQYNNAKLMRAAAESLTRKAAYTFDLRFPNEGLPNELNKVADVLTELGINPEFSQAIKVGAEAMEAGRLPMIHETPHVFVCRTCGHAVIDEPEHECPTCSSRPLTFKRFLPVYWLEALDPFSALDRLHRTPVEVASLLEGLTDEELSRQPEDGGWAIRNIISHLRDAQGVLCYRVNLLIDQKDPLIESKAVFEWATEEHERPPTTQEIFEIYQTSRHETIARLEDISLKDWWRAGCHEEFGTVTLNEQVSYFATHEVTHLPQIERLLVESLR